MSSVLPPELWKVIIDHLHADILSFMQLWSCLLGMEYGLTPHLFSKVSFGFYRKLDLLQVISAEGTTPRHICSLHLATGNEEWNTEENLPFLPFFQSLWLHCIIKDWKSLPSNRKISFEQALQSSTN
ncbi:hypothetical protein M422DRAFT_38011 [Sphaerobolus stellatus SS14]|uniref:Uncharacterized protein n=1 Tax=Sphaerobolus stellatus (strain SS14) TaxID=990650 RepID=A0A0C9UCV0_SPHS4|nr:hypothetical protein M422DRAFT_38011 [Sphaerobolus stellatus SS14]